MEETIGIKINTLADFRDAKERLSQQIRELNEKIKEVENELIEEMQEKNLEKLSSKRATVSLKIEPHPRIIDKIKFYKYAVSNNMFELLQSRVNAAPIRMMLETDNALPEGVEVYLQPKLSFRRKQG